MPSPEQSATDEIEQVGVDQMNELPCVDAPIHEMIARAGGGSAAFVGDSTYDIMAARNAGIPSVAVSFGFLTPPVEELGADAVIDRYDALISMLEKLGRDRGL